MGFMEIMRAKRLAEAGSGKKGEPREGPPGLVGQCLNKPPGGDRKAEELAQERATGFCMLSGVLNNQVDVVFANDTPDVITIGGVVYRESEIKDLLSRRLDAENLRTVHEIKRVFEGTVCEGL